MHLEIKQSTSGTETVSAQLINKLYELAYEDQTLGITSQLDATSDVQGRLEAPAAYEDAVRYLVGIDAGDPKRFQNLYITIPNNNYYIRFKDPVMAQIFNTEYGDGVGVTRAQLAAVNNLNGRFQGANNIDFFDAEDYDFQYFTGLSNYKRILDFSGHPDGSSVFVNTATYNSSVKILKKKSLIFPKTTIALSGSSDNDVVVRGAYAAKKVEFEHIDMSGTNFINGTVMVYVDCKFENVIFPSYTEQTTAFFRSNSILGKFIYPEGVTKAIDNFRACTVSYIEYPTTLTTLNGVFNEFRRDGTGGGCMVFKSVNPPTYVGAFGNSYYRLPNVIYCPANSVSLYQQWAENLELYNGYKLSQAVTVKSMAEMLQGEREMGTVTQEDIDRV